MGGSVFKWPLFQGAVCEISDRPIDNAYVKLSWSMSN